MFKMRYSVLAVGREISRKVLPYVIQEITGWFTFFRVTLSFFKDEKSQIIRLPLLFRSEFQVLKKVYFEPNSIAVSLSSLDKRSKTAFKVWEFIYSVIFIFINCLKSISRRVRRIFECMPLWNWNMKPHL